MGRGADEHADGQARRSRDERHAQLVAGTGRGVELAEARGPFEVAVDGLEQRRDRIDAAGQIGELVEVGIEQLVVPEGRAVGRGEPLDDAPRRQQGLGVGGHHRARLEPGDVMEATHDLPADVSDRCLGPVGREQLVAGPRERRDPHARTVDAGRTRAPSPHWGGGPPCRARDFHVLRGFPDEARSVRFNA